jgi:hypothetical protein
VPPPGPRATASAPAGARRARRRVLHPGRVERRTPSALVVARESKVVALARHADGDVADAGLGVEPGPQRPKGAVVGWPGKAGEAKCCSQELAALVEHGLLVGSRTGAVPGWVRLQPPSPRTAQTDFPYAALLSASRHGLCDLSTRSAFGRGPIADPVVSEESEPFMEPRRTPPLPAETRPSP